MIKLILGWTKLLNRKHCISTRVKYGINTGRKKNRTEESLTLIIPLSASIYSISLRVHMTQNYMFCNSKKHCNPHFAHNKHKSNIQTKLVTVGPSIQHVSFHSVLSFSFLNKLWDKPSKQLLFNLSWSESSFLFYMIAL